MQRAPAGHVGVVRGDVDVAVVGRQADGRDVRRVVDGRGQLEQADVVLHGLRVVLRVQVRVGHRHDQLALLAVGLLVVVAQLDLVVRRVQVVRAELRRSTGSTEGPTGNARPT